MLVTDRNVAGGEIALVDKVAEAVAGGVNVVQLREKDLSHDALVSLARRVKEAIAGRALLFVNGSPVVAREVGADGMQMAEYAPSLAERPDGLLAGRSVHSLEAARRAQAEGVDYVVFGTVFVSETHADAAPAGVRALADVCEAVPVPVIAIGGITKDRIPGVLTAGASGIAVIRAVLAGSDARAAASELRDALDSVRASA